MNELWQSIISSPLSTATLADWLDIGVLAVLVYTLLMMLRGTIAVQSLVGLGLIVGVYFVSDLTGLSTLHWVLDNVMVYAVIGMLILFQEDIRRVLAKAGGTVYQQSSRRVISESQQREQIIKAVFALAGRRIGGLVVIERAASLSRFSEGAHPIDAVITTELLLALFHPSSPVHDGAVIVAGGRITCAGVFLPISLGKGLPKAYGTRHRAAIGLTERADAIALLVSEERGTVSIVEGGQVVPVVDTNDLRQKLEELLGAEAAKVSPEVVSA